MHNIIAVHSFIMHLFCHHLNTVQMYIIIIFARIAAVMVYM